MRKKQPGALFEVMLGCENMRRTRFCDGMFECSNKIPLLGLYTGRWMGKKNSSQFRSTFPLFLTTFPLNTTSEDVNMAKFRNMVLSEGWLGLINVCIQHVDAGLNFCPILQFQLDQLNYVDHSNLVDLVNARVLMGLKSRNKNDSNKVDQSDIPHQDLFLFRLRNVKNVTRMDFQRIDAICGYLLHLVPL